MAGGVRMSRVRTRATDFTVFGASGFIGRHLVARLESLGHRVRCPERDEPVSPDRDLGHVVYCIGLTGDFRKRLLDTVEAHVNRLARRMNAARFRSWLYLSSTRLYGSDRRRGPAANEDDPICVRPSADSVYDISKLLGEALCLAQPNPAVRVVRLSNVYGAGQGAATFLGSLLAELSRTGAATIGEAPGSSKDYVAVADVVELLPQICLGGRHRLYNVASGRATTHASLARRLAGLAGGRIAFRPHGVLRRFPRIDIARIVEEFGFQPRPFSRGLAALVSRSGEPRSL